MNAAIYKLFYCHMIFRESPLWFEEGQEGYYFEEYFDEEYGEEEEETESNVSSYEESTPVIPKESDTQGDRQRSIFVHSCPSNFAAINRARKSVFGSIFLSTTGHSQDDSTLLKAVADSNYNMLQSLLNSFEKVLASIPNDSDKKKTLRSYKSSIVEMLEKVSE